MTSSTAPLRGNLNYYNFIVSKTVVTNGCLCSSLLCADFIINLTFPALQRNDNMTHAWFLPLSLKLPEDFAVVFGEAEGELAVGGVFLRIFIAQPAWVLRKPREFLIALLEKLTELLEKNNPHVSLSPQQNTSKSLLNIPVTFPKPHPCWPGRIGCFLDNNSRAGGL